MSEIWEAEGFRWSRGQEERFAVMCALGGQGAKGEGGDTVGRQMISSVT